MAEENEQMDSDCTNDDDFVLRSEVKGIFEQCFLQVYEDIEKFKDDIYAQTIRQVKVIGFPNEDCDKDLAVQSAVRKVIDPNKPIAGMLLEIHSRQIPKDPCSVWGASVPRVDSVDRTINPGDYAIGDEIILPDSTEAAILRGNNPDTHCYENTSCDEQCIVHDMFGNISFDYEDDVAFQVVQQLSVDGGTTWNDIEDRGAVKYNSDTTIGTPDGVETQQLHIESHLAARITNLLPGQKFCPVMRTKLIVLDNTIDELAYSGLNYGGVYS